MNFNGDLSNFFPPDLLMFLANLHKEGVLTVSRDDQVLTISFKNGALVDGCSAATDEKFIKALFFRRLIDKKKYTEIKKARQETDMPVRRILEDIGILSQDQIRGEIENAIKEVLFQFFLMKSGTFQFTDILVPYDTALGGGNLQGLVMDIASWADEWREMERTLISLERLVEPAPGSLENEALGRMEKIIISPAQGQAMPMAQMSLEAPISSYMALKFIHKGLATGWLRLAQDQELVASKPEEGHDLFGDFKRTFKKILESPNLKKKVANLIVFCKDYFQATLIFTVQEGRLGKGILFNKDESGRLFSKEISAFQGKLEEEPIFNSVYETGRAFFGKAFSTGVATGLFQTPPDGECAVVTLEKKGTLSRMLYVVTPKQESDQGPSGLHYLELLSWLILPAGTATVRSRPGAGDGGQTQVSDDQQASSQSKAELLVQTINDLPPMPHVVGKVHKLLSDPESSLADLAKLLSQDQSLMATLIKVSNSALYSGGQKISTLTEAVTRLGVRTIRSLVLTASTRSMFPTNKSEFGAFSHSLWRHSVECGLASRSIARFVRYPDPEEAFVAGLLHDIGRLAILLKFTEEFGKIRSIQLKEKMICNLAEKKVLGFDHTLIGELLTRKWQMPKNLQHSVRFHHEPEKSSEQDRFLAHVIAYGDYSSHMLGEQPDEAWNSEMVNLEMLRSGLGLDELKADVLQEEIIKEMAGAQAFFQ